VASLLRLRPKLRLLKKPLRLLKKPPRLKKLLRLTLLLRPLRPTPPLLRLRLLRLSNSR
jgi:hypothetical protein